MMPRTFAFRRNFEFYALIFVWQLREPLLDLLPFPDFGKLIQAIFK